MKFQFFFCSYAMQLLHPAKMLAQVHSRDTVTSSDISECRAMFMDARTSARACREQDNTTAEEDDQGRDVDMRAAD